MAHSGEGMSDEIKAFKVMDEATARAWTNPKAMADLIVQTISDQTTEAKSSDDLSLSKGDDRQHHAETGVPDTTGVEFLTGEVSRVEIAEGLKTPSDTEEGDSAGVLPRSMATPPMTGHITKSEIDSSIAKPVDRVTVVKDKGKVTLPHIPPEEMARSPSHSKDWADEAIEADDHDDHESSASEVQSLNNVVNELKGTINSLSLTLTKAMSRMDSRMSTLEAKINRGAFEAQLSSHRRVVSGMERPLSPPLPINPTVALLQPTIMAPPPLDQLTEDLLARCKSIGYTPSKLAQGQILMSLSETTLLGDLSLPLKRQEWKPDNLVRIILQLRTG
jgi:hypothetical protein